MKINKTLTALVAATGIAISGQAMAGTASGTSISNTATLSFDVNGTPVSDVSDTATFAVDTLVSMTLLSQNNPTGDAGSSVSLTYTLTNTTNGPMYFNLTGAASSTYTLDSGSTNASIVGDLAYLEVEGDSLTFSYDESISDTATDGSSVDDIASATAALSDGTALVASTEDKNDVSFLNLAQVVFAETGGTTDVDYDGFTDETASYSVTSASLTSVKTVAVDNNIDPLFGNFAIPGNTVTYTVVVTSDGTNNATGVNFSDALDTVTLDQDTVTNIVITDNDDITDLVVVTDYTIDNDASAGSSTPGTLEISLPDIPTGEHLTIKFTVTIL